MRVTKIDISGLHYDGSHARHEGYVSLELLPSDKGAPLQVQFLCHTQQAEDCPASIVTGDLIQDALRQAHRMPGFRRGERRIELGDTVPCHIDRRASA